MGRRMVWWANHVVLAQVVLPPHMENEELFFCLFLIVLQEENQLVAGRWTQRGHSWPLAMSKVKKTYKEKVKVLYHNMKKYGRLDKFR